MKNAKKGGKAGKAKDATRPSAPKRTQAARTATAQGGQSDEPAVPQSIQDVARLFMNGAAVEELVKDNSSADQRTTAVAAKRSRDPASRSPADAVPPAKKPKVARDERSAPAHSLSSSTHLTSAAPPSRKKAKAPLKSGNSKPVVAAQDDSDEDVALSRAVQAQTLSFLQHLNPKRSKAFWGMRDVAQGKGSKAALFTSASNSRDAKAGSTANKKNKKKRALADDGEELWRVGGPYVPSDEDVEEEEGDASRDDGGAGDEDDSASSSSATSSEPSWVTDGSDDGADEISSDDDDDDESDSDDSENDESGEEELSSNASKTKSGRGALPKAGGGRLFQGGDDIWDDDD